MFADTSPLVRKIGWRSAAAVVVANMVGTGIFTTTGFMARDLGSAWEILATWIAGGMIALCGALAYAELGAALPEAGGEYIYLREAYGPLAGFLSGWTSFFVGFSGAIAAALLGFAGYQPNGAVRFHQLRAAGPLRVNPYQSCCAIDHPIQALRAAFRPCSAASGALAVPIFARIAIPCAIDAARKKQNATKKRKFLIFRPSGAATIRSKVIFLARNSELLQVDVSEDGHVLGALRVMVGEAVPCEVGDRMAKR
jgi:amino acid transporter